MPTYRISDTVTYERTWIVEAPDEDTAIGMVDGLSQDALEPNDERQIDTTGYECVKFAEVEEKS